MLGSKKMTCPPELLPHPSIHDATLSWRKSTFSLPPFCFLCLLVFPAFPVSPCSHLSLWVSACSVFIISATRCSSITLWEFSGCDSLYYSHFFFFTITFLQGPIPCDMQVPICSECITPLWLWALHVICLTNEMWSSDIIMHSVFKQRFWEESGDASSCLSSALCQENGMSWMGGAPLARVLKWEGTLEQHHSP